MIDHDRLFKELLEQFFAEFVALFLPELSAQLQPKSLRFLSQEIFTDVTVGDRHLADFVVQARLRGQRSLFVIHLEHQASPQRTFNKRMFKYFSRLYEKFDRPIYPIAIFSYDTPRRAEPDSLEIGFPNFEVLRFHYRAIQLNRLSCRDYVNNPNPVASALMAKMGMAPSERARVKFECFRLMATLHLKPAKMQILAGFVDTYLRLNEVEQQQFETELATLEPDPREAVMEIVTSWEERGLHRGLEQGRLHEASLILRQLRRRVGAVPPNVESRLIRLSTPALEDLGEALLDFESVQDLEGWLSQHGDQVIQEKPGSALAAA